MSNKEIKQTINEVFVDLANALETGELEARLKIALTINGSEHGFDVMKEAVKIASNKNAFDIVLIGEVQDWTSDYEIYEASTEKEVEDQLDALFKNGTIDGCVTLHHSFPIGVSTVGRVLAPATNRPFFIATTTGTTSTNRNQAMVLNTINGIIAAKSVGIDDPTVGILNVEGANKVERSLKELASNGYPIKFGETIRSDGGAILRGNDLLVGSTDIVITDSLTGNVLMKLFSGFNTGGHVEATGYGYGPGIGKSFEDNIHIVSRASGPSVIASAMEYAYQCAKGQLASVSKEEYKLAEKAKLDDILDKLKETASAGSVEEKVTAPEKEIVTASLSGIDVLDLDMAVELLWKADIYAESGMGCAGPIVLVNEKNFDKATEIIENEGLI